MTGQYTEVGAFSLHAVVVNVTDNSDDFAERIGGGNANPFADRALRILEELASGVFGNDGNQMILVDIVPGVIAACDHRNSQSCERAGADEFKAAESGEFALGIRAAFDKNWIVGLIATHRGRGIERDGRRTRNGGEPILNFLFHAEGGFVILDLRIGNHDVEGLELLGIGETGIHLCHCVKGPDHQAGANQQDEGERDLDDDEDVARTVLFTAGAEGAAAFADSGAEANAGVFDNRDAGEKRAGNKCYDQREDKHRTIDADFANARKVFGRDGNQNAKTNISERQADDAADDSENRALEKEFASDAATSGTERRAEREFLAAAFGSDENQVRHVGADDQHYETDRTHHDPKNVANITDHVLLERANLRTDVRVLKQLDAEALRRGKRVHDDGQHARDVGVGLFECDAGLETRETVVAVVAEFHFAAIELEGSHDGGIAVVQEVERARKDSNDEAAVAIGDDGAAHNGAVAAEFAHPVPIAEHRGFRRGGLHVFDREKTASYRSDAEKRKQSVGDFKPVDLFGLIDTGDAVRVTLIHRDVLEGVALLAIDEIVRRRHVEVFDLNAGSGVPDADEAVGIGVGKRLEQDAFHNAENKSIGADAGGERDQRDGGEEGRKAQAAQDLFELLQQGLHGRSWIFGWRAQTRRLQPRIVWLR